MRIRRIRVQNLRAVKDCTLTLDDLTVLVGPNGAGKSTFLHALMLFQGDMTACKDDYHNGDTTQDIDIQITFTDLPNAVKRAFSSYTHGNELGIKRIIRWKDGKAASSLHGCLPGNPDFKAVLCVSGANAVRRQYAKLVEKPKYSSFPKLTSTTKIKEHLRNWELNNPDKYNARHNDKALSVGGVAGSTLLKRHVCFLYIPAVRDAAAGGEGGGAGSALGGLLDEITKSAFAEKAWYEDPETMLKAMSDIIMRGEGLSELDELRAGATKTLESIVPGSQIKLDWLPPSQDAGMPRAEPRLVEDGYASPVGMAGHGLQRAFIIMAALLRLPWMQNHDEPKDGMRVSPSVVLAVEEPEIYQHPTRMRHLASLFRSISQNGLDGVSDHIQVVYTTHSPHFVFADQIGQIRLVNKAAGDGDEAAPFVSRVTSTTMDAIRTRLVQCGASERTGGTIDRRLLQAVDPIVSEGFFADTVVLVEGPADRAAVSAAADALGRPLDAAGVSVIQCGGKDSIPKLAALFTGLGIRTYPIWDGDEGSGRSPKLDRTILALLGLTDGDEGHGVTESFARLDANLEETIRADLKKAVPGDDGADPYDEMLAECSEEQGHGMTGRKPLAATLIMQKVADRGIRLETFESIIEKILGPEGEHASP